MGVSRIYKATDFTRDATATPEDVRSGKVFYGTEGKQEGIWAPGLSDLEKSFELKIGGVTATTPSGKAIIIQYKMTTKEIYSANSKTSDVKEGAELTYDELGMDDTSIITGFTLSGARHYFPIRALNIKNTYRIQYEIITTQGNFTMEFSKYGQKNMRVFTTDTSAGIYNKTITLHYI